jgi:hypothetical protein
MMPDWNKRLAIDWELGWVAIQNNPASVDPMLRISNTLLGIFCLTQPLLRCTDSLQRV